MSSNFKLKRISDGEEFDLSETSLLVGRSDSCDIQVMEGHPSREHARVMERNGSVLVQDLHSTNGTFVNNKRIEVDAVLQLGDVVKFGDEAFSVQSLTAPEATVMMRSLGVGAGQSAMVIDDDEDDEDDEDSTSLLEMYAMPPGWDDGASFKGVIGKLDEKKKGAINRYIEKFNRELKGRVGIFLIFFSEDNLPIFKSVLVTPGKQSWTFGRSEDRDVCITDPCVSKHHADIHYKNGQWSIVDNNSKNGLVAKGMKASEIPLEDNATFEISSLEVLVSFVKAK